MTMTLAKSALTDRFSEFAPLPTAAADYDIVRRAIAHIRGNWRAQPEIDTIAHAAGVTPTDLHHLFRRWCGLTPKAFLQALTLNHARELLRSSASVLDTAYEVGLSGPGRLHDLFVSHEAMSPGEWKAGGEGLMITDVDDTVRYVNSRMSDICGYTAEEMTGKPAYTLLLPGGEMRAGTADRRGAVFETAIPDGTVQLGVPAALAP